MGNRRPAFYAVAPLILLVHAGAAQAIEIEAIAITTGPFRTDGGTPDYRLTFSVEATGLIGGSVSKPGTPPTPLCDLEFSGASLYTDESWGCELEGFSNLQEICQTVGFGGFQFDLTAAAGADDQATLFFDPGCADLFAGHPTITAPTSGGVVPPLPGSNDFCYDCSTVGGCGPRHFGTFIADPASGDVAGELRRDETLPSCWSPAICLPPGQYEFDVAAFQFQSDEEPATSALGDSFLYLSAFESSNQTDFDVVDAPPTTPPAVPSGRGGTLPMRVRKASSDGANLEILWDADSCCGAANHHLIWGRKANLPTTVGANFGIAGSRCNLGPAGGLVWNGTPTASPGDFVWWLILADDGISVEGSWGNDSHGVERNGPGTNGASTACGFGSKNLSNACGR